MSITLGIILVNTLKIKVLKIIITIVCILSIFTSCIFSRELWEEDKCYFEFNSPNNKTIIIEECSWLQGGWSNVYQKESSNIDNNN